MSYQVLARKWRPGNFHEMVGQEHVLRALINALDHNRLHHAYLFTGTRGVGKTTIARILAKCLNCEVGVSSNPCGQCSACTEIAEGRFVDLIEVDAASRTKVEDTRELLENVQYAPTRGRYKVYLIDEVHMLSGHSFNALLKTLEEPPPHVKFLLATTDPQKLPVTILSRCLQFHLKNMSQERIVGHLTNVLAEESIPTEETALWQLARAADGSMRDALSLTDQAIAFGNGSVNEQEVSAMLGTIDRSHVYDILESLSQLDSVAVLNAVAEMSEQSPDYAAALAEVISVLHRVALAQVAPQALDNSLGDRDQLIALAEKIASEDVQLFYQIALHGRRDLPLNPDPRSGFEMTLLRMLAFKPQGVVSPPKGQLPTSNTTVNTHSGGPVSQSAAPIAPATQTNKESAEPAPAPAPGAKTAADPAVSKPASAESAAKPAINSPIKPAVEQTPAVEQAPVTQQASSQPSVAKQPMAETPVAQSVVKSPVQELLTQEPVAQEPRAARNANRPESPQARTSQLTPQQQQPARPPTPPVDDVPSEYDEYASQVADYPEAGAVNRRSVESTPAQPRAEVNKPAPQAPQEKKKSLFESITEEAEARQSQGSNLHVNQAQAPSVPISAPISAPISDFGPVSDSVPQATAVAEPSVPALSLDQLSPENWLDVYLQLNVNGILQSTVSNCVYLGRDEQQLHFLLDKSNATLYSDSHPERFAGILSEYFGHSVGVDVTLGDVASETPAIRATRIKRERHQEAVHLVQSDPLVQQLVNQFAVVIDPEKIEPLA
ncbi:DNA polymerase III subunit gamma/tau [Sessilibacter corallicola]|uniref:DNA polymerase III subunit gamma/tau n=1 Tax=Sessilibacter corallicola TaxID=2904075 RepID=A0ABQ0A4W3_9GAMM